ncbi:GIY-YIG nuclease family protein [Streptomyces sp. NPDC053367]|uniref:GIY-YIG nuclease family protein n=1 Tax=Streptomyces sp. NPDC053367 TaxID=3365700 RepID=UPI0037D38BD1
MPRPFRRPTKTVNETVHGIDVSYEIPDTTPLPRLPFNLDATLRRALFIAATLMTAGAIIWGTVAIGSMLDLLAPAWAAYLVAGVFDAGWAACLIAEWLLRYDSRRAALPRNVGVGMLAVSMAAIITHGALSGSWGWIVGIVGALVSAAAKGVWAIGMHTIRIQLDPKYEAYLRALQQQTGTEQALALTEWDRRITEDRTVKLRLALEARRPVAEPAVEQVSAPAAPARKESPAEPAGPVGQEIDDLDGLLAQAHTPVVYFLRNGTRVKIGTTRNLRRRIAGLALRPDDVVRVEHGGQDYEQSLHARFDDYRVGNTEWFELRGELAAYLGEPEAQPLELTAQFVEPTAHAPEPSAAGGGLSVASAQATTDEPGTLPSAPEAHAFGFSAHLTGQAAQRAKAVAQVAELLAQDPGLTSGQVAEELAVSPATAKRYLREARQAK